MGSAISKPSKIGIKRYVNISNVGRYRIKSDIGISIVDIGLSISPVRYIDGHAYMYNGCGSGSHGAAKKLLRRSVHTHICWLLSGPQL